MERFMRIGVRVWWDRAFPIAFFECNVGLI